MGSQKSFEYSAIILLVLAAVFLTALQLSLTGWFFWLLGASMILFCARDFARNIVLLYISVAILAFAPVNTGLSTAHILTMGVFMALALGIPYALSRFIYKEHTIIFNFHPKRSWYKKEILYISSAAIAAYIVLPFFLKNTGSYLNWTVEPTVDSLTRLFICANAFGIWDELFFVGTVFTILKKYVPFLFANIAQSIIFTGFLYELGFRGWGFVMIFFFAFSQGYVYKKTSLLLYIVSIHLAIDFILFLALIYTHYPSLMPIFFQ